MFSSTSINRRVALVIALALLVVGITAGAALAGQSPVQRIIAQENAQRVAAATRAERIASTFSAPSTVQVVTSGGFHWGDFGVGIGSGLAVVLLGFGLVLVVRSRPLSHV